MQIIEFKDILPYASILVNFWLLFVNLKVKAEILELKVWIVENFERRKNQ